MSADDKAEILAAIAALGARLDAMDKKLDGIDKKLDIVASNTLGPSQARAIGIHADPSLHHCSS